MTAIPAMKQDGPQRGALVWEAMAVVGRVARAHGNRGEVIVNPDTDFPADRFHPGAVVYVQRETRVEPLEVTSLRFHRQRPIVGIAGVGSMAAAGSLAGAELRVPLNDLQRLPAGHFYRHDLVGCTVQTTTGEVVGTVASVDGEVGRSRLVVLGPRGEVLVPMAQEICVSIDTDSSTIVIDPPDGLLDLNTATGRKTNGAG